MNKSILEIATIRNIAYYEAEEFSRAVFRHFVGRVPKYEVVAQAVIKDPTASPTEIAQALGAIPQPALKQAQPAKARHLEPPSWLPRKPQRISIEPSRPKHTEPPLWLPGDRTVGSPPSRPPFTHTNFVSTGQVPNERTSGKGKSIVDLDNKTSDYCPHGRRRREYCAICDPDGYVRNFGDWTRD